MLRILMLGSPSRYVLLFYCVLVFGGLLCVCGGAFTTCVCSMCMYN